MAGNQVLISAEDLQRSWAPLIDRNNQQYMKIKELEAALEKKNGLLDDLFAINNGLDAKIEELNRTLEEKDRTICELAREIEMLYEVANNYELELQWGQSNEND